MFATLHNAMSTEEDGFYMPRHELRLEVNLYSLVLMHHPKALTQPFVSLLF